MSKSKEEQLKELLLEVRKERVDKICKESGLTPEEFEDLSFDDKYDLDDGDRLLEGIDIVLGNYA